MSRRPYVQVPTTREVVVGAPVNIVLKVDQPTGRTVAGVVRDVLTRGNHPRGIKVRLTDGRVGRVQTMAPFSDATGAQTGPPSPPDPVDGLVDAVQTASIADAQDGAARQEWPNFRRGPRRRQQRRGGASEQEDQDLPSEQIGLDAYIKPARPRRAARGKPAETSSGAGGGDDGPTKTVTCPVCGTFEGDEAAVAHHVAGHFDS